MRVFEQSVMGSIENVIGIAINTRKHGVRRESNEQQRRVAH
jgi:hypothetical protein